MSQKTNYVLKALPAMALAMLTIFASCKKETDIDAVNAEEKAAIAINPTQAFCKPVSIKLSAVVPRAAVVATLRDSLYNIKYDNQGRPISATGKDFINRIYQHSFEYDANNNLTFVKEYLNNQVNRYQKLTYPNGSSNSMSNKITVTTYLRTNGILKEVGKTDFFFNVSGKLISQLQQPAASNTPYYYVYNNAGNLQYIALGSINGNKVNSFLSYDNEANVYNKHRVWQLLSGQFSTNNNLLATSTWHDYPAPVLRPMTIAHQYQKNGLGQIDKVVVTRNYQQADGSYRSEVYPVVQIWKNSCDNSIAVN